MAICVGNTYSNYSPHIYSLRKPHTLELDCCIIIFCYFLFLFMFRCQRSFFLLFHFFFFPSFIITQFSRLTLVSCGRASGAPAGSPEQSAAPWPPGVPGSIHCWHVPASRSSLCECWWPTATPVYHGLVVCKRRTKDKTKLSSIYK